MSAFNSQSSKDANDAQKAKYPDISAEMRRRASLRQTHSGGRATTKEARARAKLGWEKRRAKADQALKSQETAQSFDRTQEP